MKVQGQKWAMLTAYDMYSATIFEEAGIPVLLVGDSASNAARDFALEVGAGIFPGPEHTF
jgi:ketopantoate hydroxymethyltransferase